MDATHDVSGLFSSFDFSLLDSSEFKEDSVREEIVLPVLKALGYAASGHNRIVRSKAVSHPFVMVGAKRRNLTNFPDYLLQAGNRNAWVLDAKSPDEEIKEGKNREQTFFYAIHPEIRVRFYALCNGREFIVFDRDKDEPVLYFHLSEIAQHWTELEALLAPEAFAVEAAPVGETKDERKREFDYASIKPLPEILNVRKQSAKRHFGVHGYFTKQAYSVVQAYIKNFTKPGDVVLDPFGGSGVTIIEALMLGRKGVHIDINPLSVFIVRNLIQPVQHERILDAFENIKSEFEANAPQSEEEIKEALARYPHPQNIRLMKNADVDSIEELFSPLQLAQLAYLKRLISQVDDALVREQLLLAFSSSLNKFNLTFHYTRSDGGGDSSAFRYYRYRIAPSPGSNPLMQIFETKLKRLLAAKKEIANIINDKTIRDAEIYKGTATDLNRIADESVDYIYTDPPYGAKIPYLDLSVMWNAWLDLPVSDEDFQMEAIEGGERRKSKREYSDLLARSIEEMYRALKLDRWMSFVFSHKDPAYWRLIVDTAERIGFEYAGAVPQKNGQTSFKKRQNPFTVISGQLIINFKKVRNPKTIMKVNLGADITEIIMQTIEGIIAARHGATIEEINDELVIKGLELGFLDVLSQKYQDLPPFLAGNFDYDAETTKYQIRKNTKFKTRIDVHLRIRYYLLSYLRRMTHQGYDPTFEDVVWNIMPLLKNGQTPENQTILNVLETVAERVGEDRWRLQSEGQRHLFDHPASRS